MELEGNSNAETSAAFLRQLRERHTGSLTVIWDNAPAHHVEVIRECLRTPRLSLLLVNPRFQEGRRCRTSPHSRWDTTSATNRLKSVAFRMTVTRNGQVLSSLQGWTLPVHQAGSAGSPV